ncbi:MAG TPA: hypothetical protein VIV60_28710 [Polyangiaceae bacterium]
MNLLELCILYAFAGVVSAALLQQRSEKSFERHFVDLVLAFLLWPLWLPIALSKNADPNKVNTSRPWSESEQSLREGYAAVKGTPLERLLPLASVERIAVELRRVYARNRELSELLVHPNFSLERAQSRVAELEQSAAPPRTVAMARRHVENVERLAALHRRDQQLHEELVDWLSTLRTQLVLARFSGSSTAAIGDIFAEVCARVEVLGSTLDESTQPSWPNTYC